MSSFTSKLRFSESKSIDVEKLLALYQFGWWSTQRKKSDVEKMFEHTPMVISVWDGDLLVGFTRLLTDFTYRATIWDVIILPEYQSQGIGKKIMEYILTHPKLKTVTFFWLSTKDKHTFYEQFGFVRDQTESMILKR
jgi:GNAT superfamily N-acetyltransferase